MCSWGPCGGHGVKKESQCARVWRVGKLVSGGPFHPFEILESTFFRSAAIESWIPQMCVVLIIQPIYTDPVKTYKGIG